MTNRHKTTHGKSWGQVVDAKTGVYPAGMVITWSGEDGRRNARLCAGSADLLAALKEAQIRLRGAGMLGGPDDTVNRAIERVAAI